MLFVGKIVLKEMVLKQLMKLMLKYKLIKGI